MVDFQLPNWRQFYANRRFNRSSDLGADDIPERRPPPGTSGAAGFEEPGSGSGVSEALLRGSLGHDPESKSGTANVGKQEGMARPERFELPTFWFVARRSIQLS